MKQASYQKNNDIHLYLNKMNLLMNDKKLVRKMKKKCLAESRKYDWKKVCNKYIKLYKKILNQN